MNSHEEIDRRGFIKEFYVLDGKEIGWWKPSFEKAKTFAGEIGSTNMVEVLDSGLWDAVVIVTRWHFTDNVWNEVPEPNVWERISKQDAIAQAKRRGQEAIIC